MIQETMTIHEALAELKMLDKRIQRRIQAAVFCTAYLKKDAEAATPAVARFTKDAKEAYASITDMLNRRKAIRNALSRSNASTTIEVDGVSYTVAEALEMKKTGVSLWEELVSRMSGMYCAAENAVTRANEESIPAAADKFIAACYGNVTDAKNAAEIEAARKAYIEERSYTLIDPLGAKEIMGNLSERIERFRAAVDSKISVSNAITTITIEY